MGTALTDTVASVSGSNNEILTMTTGGMTVNAYRYHHILYQRLIYIIASNTATTITLETPTSSYPDLTGEEVVVKVNYISYMEVKEMLGGSEARADGGSIGNSIATKKEIIRMLNKIDGKINFQLKLQDETVNATRYLDQIADIENSVVAMMFMRASRFRRVNPGDDAVAYWTITPEFTRQHLSDLRGIKKMLNAKDGTAFGVYNINTGRVIN